jgi:RimJ/RimL family protein N-acetyltransferase
MTQIPTLDTSRLTLRCIQRTDAPALQTLMADYEIAANALNIPHPLPEGEADYWIRRTLDLAAGGTRFPFVIVRRCDRIVLGTAILWTHPADARAEMGYWLGKPYWQQGYMTEAVQRVIRFAFEELEMNRVQAACFPWNAASARVMEKAGLTYEGRMRQHVLKWGKFEDLDYYGLLREQWREIRTAPE